MQKSLQLIPKQLRLTHSYPFNASDIQRRSLNRSLSKHWSISKKARIAQPLETEREKDGGCWVLEVDTETDDDEVDEFEEDMGEGNSAETVREEGVPGWLLEEEKDSHSSISVLSKNRDALIQLRARLIGDEMQAESDRNFRLKPLHDPEGLPEKK